MSNPFSFAVFRPRVRSFDLPQRANVLRAALIVAAIFGSGGIGIAIPRAMADAALLFSGL